MKFNELSVRPNKSAKRVGRGISAGSGKTAGRGTKGQGARSGYSRKPGFEGGQNPLMQRLPKLRGFSSKRREVREVIYVEQLNSLKLKDAKVDNFVLAEAGLIKSQYSTVKLLNKGTLDKALKISVQSASKTAITSVENAGGEVSIVARQARQATKK